MTVVPLSSSIDPPSRLSAYWGRATALSRSRAFLALADQGVTSIGNFATIILVLRALSLEQFGMYSILIEAYLFLNSIQAALVVYPLLVKGAAMDVAALRRLSGACSILTVALGLMLALGLVGTAGFVHSPRAVWLLAPLAMLLSQVQETLRRTLIAHLRFGAAIPGDAISYILQAAILWVLVKHNALTVPSIFIVMAVTSALAALLQAFQVGLRFDIGWKELRTLARDFFTAGKWIMLANFATIIAFQGYSWTLKATHGLEQVGQAGLIGNMLRFANPIIQALAGATIPAVSRAAAQGRLPQARKAALKFGTLAGLFVIPFFALLIIFPEQSLATLSKSPADELATLAPLLRVYTIAFAATALNAFVLAYLNGLGYSRVNFIGMAANAVVSLFIGLPLVVMWGVKGTMWGGGLANVVMTAVTIFLAFKYKHKMPPGPSELVPQSAAESQVASADLPLTPA